MRDGMTGVLHRLQPAVVEVVARRLREHGWTQAALAAAVGLSQPTVSRLLRGQVDLSLDAWQQVAEAVGTDLETLIAEAQQLVRQTSDTD